MSIPVQCTRCRNKHQESDRVSKRVDSMLSELLCPCCSCKSYFDLRLQIAWCWVTGLIEIGDELPQDSPDGSGAIEIARGPKAFLKSRLEVLARHGMGASAGMLLVPGVPEADTPQKKADALAAWLAWCGGRAGRDGVSFSKEAAK